MKALRNGLLVLLLLLAAPVYSHTDLDLQIEEISRQLERQTDNVDLLLRRGDLQRRHENRALALEDFNRVRDIQPDNSLVDWFEGRLQIETGQPQEGVRLLDRFLLANPDHSIALQNRAQGYLLLEQPLLAAQDFKTVIRVSAKPTPSLYNSAASALVQAGADHYSEAMDVVQEGLGQFPTEITLMGMGTDISLARQDTETAARLINQLPMPLQKLSQWQLRWALLNCQSGQQALASNWFTSASKIEKIAGPNVNGLSHELLTELAEDASAFNCQAASVKLLNQ